MSRIANMSTVRAIAEEVGVSATTVSRVLNNHTKVSDKTRQLVLTVANRAGYKVRNGRRGVSAIGFAYTNQPTLGSVFDSALLSGIVCGADATPFGLMILNLRRDLSPGESYTQFFLRMGVGAVILRTTAEGRQVCKAIADEGFPAVVVAERFDDAEISFVDCESRTDSIRAVEHLIELGHRRIAFAMNNVPDCDHLDRFEGYKLALANHDLPVHDELVFLHPASLAGGATIMNLAMNMAARPTAIYLADPLLAVGALNQAHVMGVCVPEEISIVGFDDSNVRTSVFPLMTAVCQNTIGLGYQAAVQVAQMLERSSPASQQLRIPSFFEIHQSTGPAPNGHARQVRQNGRRTSEVNGTRRRAADAAKLNKEAE